MWLWLFGRIVYVVERLDIAHFMPGIAFWHPLKVIFLFEWLRVCADACIEWDCFVWWPRLNIHTHTSHAYCTRTRRWWWWWTGHEIILYRLYNVITDVVVSFARYVWCCCLFTISLRISFVVCRSEPKPNAWSAVCLFVLRLRTFCNSESFEILDNGTGLIGYEMHFSVMGSLFVYD